MQNKKKIIFFDFGTHFAWSHHIHSNLNFIQLWEWTWCHRIFYGRTEMYALLSGRSIIHAWLLKGAVKMLVETGYDVMSTTKSLTKFRLADYLFHTPDMLGTLPDIAANARPLRAWLKCRTITTHAHKSVADLSRNCKGFCARESVHARVTESRAQGTGVGRDIRQSPSRVRSVFLLIYDLLTICNWQHCQWQIWLIGKCIYECNLI